MTLSIEHWTERVFCLLAFAFYLCLFTVSACWNNDEMYSCNNTRNILYFCAELCLLSLCVAGTKDPKHPSCRMSPLRTMRLEPILTLDPVTHGDVAQLIDFICNLSKKDVVSYHTCWDPHVCTCFVFSDCLPSLCHIPADQGLRHHDGAITVPYVQVNNRFYDNDRILKVHRVCFFPPHLCP